MKKLLLLILMIVCFVGVYSQKIEDLPAAAAIVATDLIILDQSDATRHINITNLFGTIPVNVVIEPLATPNTTVLTPTSTGLVDTLETSDITEITLDTLDVNYLTVNSHITYTHREAMTYISTEGTQTIETGGTFERLNEGAIAYTPAHLVGWTHDDGRLTYIGAESQHFLIQVNATIESDEVAALVQIRLAKGGSTIAGTNMQEDYTVQDTDASIGFSWIEEMATGEYLEVFGTSDTNGDTFLVHSMTFTITL